MSDSHLLSKNNILPEDYQKPLVSGTDIKTVNSNSLLGSGNISLQEPIIGAASSVLSSNLTESRSVISNANGKLDVSSTTATELGYVHGVTSNIQTQLNGKANVDLSNLDATGQAKFDAKANVSNTVTTDTAQTISGVKTFSDGTLHTLKPVLLKQNNANEGGQIDFERSNNSVLKTNPYIDLLINTIRFIGINSNNDLNITLQVNLENNQVWVPTPALTANDTQAATTAWFNSKMQVVSALPANPDPNVFYFIPG